MATYTRPLVYNAYTPVNRRPVSRRTELPVSIVPARHTGARIVGSFTRRPEPTVRQFSGTIVPNEVRRVSLVRLEKGELLETTTSNASGVFSFRGWYPPFENYYAFRFHAGNGYNEQTFPLLPPIEQIWRGDPTKHDSAVV